MSTTYYSLFFFFIGTFFGSFYNVVGLRLPKKESIAFPPSHCTKCNYRLKILDLIPIFSFLFLKGKCRKCREEISYIYPFVELFTGVMFFISYIVFGFSIELAVSLIFVSMMSIVIVSDTKYMIIPDEIIVFFFMVLIVLSFVINGPHGWMGIISDAFVPFTFMLLIKLLGDFLFKKETLGGGDIKLLLIIGLLLGWENALISVFVGAILAFPISLYFYFKDKEHMLPFGPYLCLGAIILYYLGLSALDIFRLFY